MKHCPQCEFTFDDQQQFCDFDGTELSVVPERVPSFKTVSFAPAGSGSFVRRLVKSRAGLPVLALAGVALSALLVGYYDSLSQANIEVSNQTSNDTASTSKSTQVDNVGVETKTDRHRIISTQRRLGADELPSSMVKRLLEGSHSRSSNSRRDPSATKLVASKRGPSATKLVATKRGPSSSKLVGTKRKPANASRQSQARNPARLDSRERVRQQHRAARANRQPRWNSTAPRSNSTTVANRRLGVNEHTHHRKDSKVVAILKKTGSILTKPFKLIAGR